MKLASLSLSSPALAQRQPQHQREEIQPKTELHSGLAAQVSRLDVGLDDGEQGQAAGQDNSGTCDVDARGTMTAPMGRHCFVDVAHLQQQQRLQQQQQLQDQLSVVGCQSGAASNPAGRARPNGEFSNCYVGTDRAATAVVLSFNHHDGSRSNNKSDASDNGIGITGTQTGGAGGGCRLLPGGGVVAAVAGGSSAKATTGDAATAAAHGYGRLSDSGQAQVSASRAECAQSANACCSVLELPNWRSRQKQNRPEAADVATALATCHAPSQQQRRQELATGSTTTATAATTTSLTSARNHSIEQNRLPVQVIGTNSQQAPATQRSSKLVAENFPPVDYSANSNNNTANNSKTTLMGSCCESWRHALQLNKSGTYKVAHYQQQVEPISGTNLSPNSQANAVASEGCPPAINVQHSHLQQQHQQLQETAAGADQQRGQHFVATIVSNNNDNIITNQSNQVTERKLGTRHFRPGRSPRTLQRLTNARLAKHRLKIQQQRQEQLAQLAIRERQQLVGQHRMQTSSSRIEEQPTVGGGIYTTNEQAGVQLTHGLPDRLRLGQQQYSERVPHLSHHQRFNRFLGESSSSSQQQVIPPNLTRIEICDNQLACSSSSSNSNRTSFRPYHYIARSNKQSGGNVFVYKSSNMLRNSSIADHAAVANGGWRSSTGGVENDEIESDPDTISSSSSSNLGSTSSLNKPFCKVCHIGATKNGDKLISPCRCSGTMQYIHCGCLLKWLEISNRSNEKPMSCELCAHEYTWHKKFNYRRITWPKCSMKDVILHTIFLLAIGVMLFSGISPMLHKKSNESSLASNTLAPSTPDLSNQVATSSEQQVRVSQQQQATTRPYSYSTFTSANNRLKHSSGHLADDEKFMLICAASFFMSFFLAIYVQTKARDTLYGLIAKFLSMNHTYYITEYDHGQLGANGAGANNCGNSKQQYAEDSSRGSDRKNSNQKK